MQSREQPREQIGDNREQQSFRSLVERTSEGVDPDSLTVRQLLGLVAQRILMSAPVQIAHLNRSLLKLRSRLPSLVAPASEQRRLPADRVATPRGFCHVWPEKHAMPHRSYGCGSGGVSDWQASWC